MRNKSTRVFFLLPVMVVYRSVLVHAVVQAPVHKVPKVSDEVIQY